MSNDKEKKSFWKTIGGMITAIGSVLAVITTLIGIFSDFGVILDKLTGNPTPFPYATPLDIDATLPPVEPVTPEPEPAIPTEPTCTNFEVYEGKVNRNAVMLAYTDTDFWVWYGNVEEEVEALEGVTISIFGTGESANSCLRQWVKYLSAEHAPHWPPATDSKGHALNEVWLSSSSPPLMGELAFWTVVPDVILVTVVDEDFNPQYVRIYMCGEDIPAETLSHVVFWHAATSGEALTGYLELYESNGYEVQSTVYCSE